MTRSLSRYRTLRKELLLTDTNKSNPFGERDWSDVRRVLASNVLKRWSRMPLEDLEDALSAAIEDLYGYWFDLASSITPDNPGKNFSYACKRGTWTATNFLVKVFEHYSTHTSLDVGPEDEPRPHDWPDHNHDPLDIICDRETIDEVRSAVSNLTEADLDRWYTAFMQGESTRTAGEAAGVSHVAVAKRRQEGIRRLKVQVTA